MKSIAARARGLLGDAEPAAVAAQFFGLLMGDLMIRLLLRVAAAPHPREVKRRAKTAADTLLALNPPAVGRTRRR